jgi:hypothetical protein
MNTLTHQKEILLVSDACFFSKHWAKKQEVETNNGFTQKEKLMDACWNGMVSEMLPECFDVIADYALRIWCISDTNAFVNLNFWDGEEPSEQEFALNPYIFMEIKDLN